MVIFLGDGLSLLAPHIMGIFHGKPVTDYPPWPVEFGDQNAMFYSMRKSSFSTKMIPYYYRVRYMGISSEKVIP